MWTSWEPSSSSFFVGFICVQRIQSLSNLFFFKYHASKVVASFNTFSFSRQSFVNRLCLPCCVVRLQLFLFTYLLSCLLTGSTRSRERVIMVPPTLPPLVAALGWR
jgi:hypothetical protein